MSPPIDPRWWDTAAFAGRPIRDVHARRDAGTLFQFLRRCGVSRARISALTGLTETRVRQIAQGRQQVTSYEVLERLACGLSIPRGYLGLGYADMSVPSLVHVDDPSGDPGFLGTLAALAFGSGPFDPGAFMDLPSAIGISMPSTVTADHVAMVRDVTDGHRRFDADHGGGCCRDSAATYLRWALGMLDARFATDDVRRQLLVALADLHQVVGWACHDLGDHGRARRYLAAALALARQADDLRQAAGCLYRLGRISIHQHRATEALKLWQLGQILAQDSGCLISVAVLHANEAWAYAQLGDAPRVRDSLARAEDELGRASADSAPTWAEFFLAPADIDGSSGVVYGCLATHAQHRDRYAPMALDHASRALTARRTGEARSRVFDAITTATGHLLTGDVTAAQVQAHLAVDLAGSVASLRVCDRFEGMLALAPTGCLGEVAERVAALRSG